MQQEKFHSGTFKSQYEQNVRSEAFSLIVRLIKNFITTQLI
jgi:hypothetical protein